MQTHLRLVPQSAEGHCRLGQVYLEAKNYQRAQQYFLAALEILPTSPTARDGLASALAGLGQTEQAEKYRDAEMPAQSADRREPEVESVSDEVQLAQTRSAAAFALTDIGRVHGARGDLPEALKLWTRAAEIDPQHLECRQLLVSIYQQSQEYEKALHFLEQLAAIEPGNPVHQVNIGVLASQTGRFDDAEKAFRRVQQLIPDRYEGYAGLAKLYLDGNKDAAEAQRSAQKAVDLAPIGGNFYLLGRAQLKGGNLKEALTALERALELERGNLIYQQALEEVRAGIGEKEASP
ncbi:MAG: tetratricopeptide repeat protein [Planctomycetaceae bacterium]|nr:tetratricopeptide repeat protein [Planctomycetaceae bacterium]